MITVLLDNARAVVRAEALCAAAGIDVAVVPAPSEHSHECGMALRMPAGQRAAFERLMKNNSINVVIL